MLVCGKRVYRTGCVQDVHIHATAMGLECGWRFVRKLEGTIESKTNARSAKKSDVGSGATNSSSSSSSSSRTRARRRRK